MLWTKHRAGRYTADDVIEGFTARWKINADGHGDWSLWLGDPATEYYQFQGYYPTLGAAKHSVANHRTKAVSRVHASRKAGLASPIN